MQISKKLFALLAILMIASLVLSACGMEPPATRSATQPVATTAPAEESAAPAVEDAEPLVFGMILVGPQNDHGWSQAHFEGGRYIVDNLPSGAEMIVFDLLNPADKPEATLEGVVDDMVSQGARLIFTTSDEFEEDTTTVAAKYPDVVFINSSGDDAWSQNPAGQTAPANLGNIMGRAEYVKAIAGCAAALTTQTGQIGYLGPLINFETRRLVASAYLGASYCYEHYRGLNPTDLQFTVSWIGFWFNIPGVTADPTEVATNFFDTGVDVLMSGIDTTEALGVAGQRRAAGEDVWAIPYDYLHACENAPEACLGVPFFNWGPAYLATAQAVQNGTWQQSWDWNGPYWDDLADLSQTAVGWVNGPALPESVAADLADYMALLASRTVNPWTGPIVLQDGTVYVAEGTGATEAEVWYLPLLPAGVTGPSQ